MGFNLLSEECPTKGKLHGYAGYDNHGYRSYFVHYMVNSLYIPSSLQSLQTIGLLSCAVQPPFALAQSIALI